MPKSLLVTTILSFSLISTALADAPYSETMFNDTVDEFTGKREVYAGVAADRMDNYSFPYQDATPVIIVKCVEKELDVVFIFDHQIKSDYETNTVEVMVKYDTDPVITFDGVESTDSRAVFSPNAFWTAKKLTNVNKVSVRATPPFSARITFYVDNIPSTFWEHVKTVIAACGLKF